MSNSYLHAQSCVRKWGGVPEDYIAIHEFLDGTKKAFGDVRHRALLHNTFGVWLAQEVFGRVIKVKRKATDTYKTIPVREIAERHIIEDLGFIPEVGDWLRQMDIQDWMSGAKRRTMTRESIKDV